MYLNIQTMDISFNSLTTVALIFCATLLCFVKYRRRRGLPPGPTGLPFLGSIVSTGIQPLRHVEKLRQQYGDVFTLMFGNRNVIIVNGNEAMRELIIKHADAVSDRPSVSQLQLVSNGLGIVGSSGSLWKEQRSFALKTLRSFGFGKRSLENQILEEIDIFMEEFRKMDGKPFNPREMLSVAISNIICSIVFGRRFEHDDERLHIVLSLVNENFTSNNSFRFISNIFPWVRYLPGDFTGMKSRLQNISKIKNFLREQIQCHKDSFDENNIRDYIDAFLSEQIREKDKTDSTFTDEQLLQSLRDLFVAGSETTATTLRWAILFLVTNQNIQKKMRDEIDNVIGQNVTPSMEHKAKLPYCEAVINEVQRLGNIAPFAVPHGVRYDVMWKDYVIPKDATLLLNLESIGMDPKTFPNPEKFDPDRFLDQNGSCIGQSRFIPFSLGRRVCLGESLARMEIFLFVISLVQNFELRKEDDQSQPSCQPVRGATRSPQPFKIRTIPRN
ncbi:hypothetical protein FSP39_010875 [Pinctada imbricata]|uniref:Cytochrome P450 n=1 Tax=Pinctada imbricata TaxID=66713 RepID=A0AA88XD45_PINIB|nr:hypothetical protein FSP39_010875 [Pinctada imbricata]